MGKDSLGELEELILLAILRIGEAAYGVAIVEQLRDQGGRRVAPAAVYVTLRRLEEAGLLTSRKEREPRGRPRRFVEVTARGIELLREARTTRLRMWEGLGDVLEDG